MFVLIWQCNSEVSKRWLETVALPCGALGDKLLSFCAVYAFSLKEDLWPWQDYTLITAESEIVADETEQWTPSHEPHGSFTLQAHSGSFYSHMKQWHIDNRLYALNWISIYKPDDSFPTYLSKTPFDLAEAFVKGQVVTNWVLPTSGSIREIREVLENPAIDFFHRQRFAGRLLNGHVDEERKGERGLRLQGVPLPASAVWRGWGGGRRRALVGPVVPLYVKQGASAGLSFRTAQSEVLKQVLVQPVEVGELLILVASSTIHAGRQRTWCTLRLRQCPHTTNTSEPCPLLLHTRDFRFLIWWHPNDWTH